MELRGIRFCGKLDRFLTIMLADWSAKDMTTTVAMFLGRMLPTARSRGS
jgi:hypothetical protein